MAQLRLFITELPRVADQQQPAAVFHILRQFQHRAFTQQRRVDDRQLEPVQLHPRGVFALHVDRYLLVAEEVEEGFDAGDVLEGGIALAEKLVGLARVHDHLRLVRFRRDPLPDRRVTGRQIIQRRQRPQPVPLHPAVPAVSPQPRFAVDAAVEDIRIDRQRAGRHELVVFALERHSGQITHAGQPKR